MKLAPRYRILVQWKGPYDPSWEYRSDLVSQSTNSELLQEIDDAVQRCRAEIHDTEPDDDPVVANEKDEDLAPVDTSEPGRRSRKATEKYTPTWMVSHFTPCDFPRASRSLVNAGQRLLAVHAAASAYSADVVLSLP